MSIDDHSKVEEGGSIMRKRLDSVSSTTPSTNRLVTVTSMLTAVLQLLGQTKLNITEFISK